MRLYSVIRRVPRLPMAQVLDLKMSKSSCQIPSEALSLQPPSLCRRHKPTEFPPMPQVPAVPQVYTFSPHTFYATNAISWVKKKLSYISIAWQL